MDSQSSFRRTRGRDRAPLAVGLVLAAAMVTASAAPAQSASVKPPPIKLEVEKYTLSNGLEVILHEDHRLPLVAVNTWYHVGPANETAGRTGFAHLFEHMMFQSSGHVGEDQIWKYLEGAGASFINGTTDFDRTNYLEDLPANQLELALWLESDRMGFLLDRIDEASLATQKDVVRNERRQSVENAPYQIVEEEMWHLIFPKNHPYYPWVIGSHEDAQAAKLDDVKEFFRRYYCPNNASLVIVGDIDKVKTKALVEKYYGSIPRGADVPPITATTPPITEERRETVTDKITLPRVYMSWLTSPIFKPGDAGQDAGRCREGDRRGAHALLGGRPHRGGGRRDPELDLLGDGDKSGKLRRILGRRRPPQPVQPPLERPELPEQGPRAVRRGHAGFGEEVRERPAQEEPARGRLRRTGRQEASARPNGPAEAREGDHAGGVEGAVAEHGARSRSRGESDDSLGEAHGSAERPGTLRRRGAPPADRRRESGVPVGQRRRSGRPPRARGLHGIDDRR